MKKLEKLVRPNIWRLKPYSSARDEFKGEASVFLDATKIRTILRITAILTLYNGKLKKK